MGLDTMNRLWMRTLSAIAALAVTALFLPSVSAQNSNWTGPTATLDGAPLSAPLNQSLRQTIGDVSVVRAKNFVDQVAPPPTKPAVAKPASNDGIVVGPDTRFIVDSQVPSRGKTSSAAAAARTTQVSPLHQVPLARRQGKIKLNFSNADAGVVIDFMAKMLGLIPVISPGMSLKITVRTPGEVTVERAYAILSAVMNNLNYSVICTDDGYMKVVEKKDAPQYALKIYFGTDPGLLPDSDEMITALIPCQNISATDLLKYIQPLASVASGANTISADPAANLLIVSDVSSNIRRMLKMIAYLDVPDRHQFNDIETSVYYLNYLKAVDMANCLTSAFNIKSSVTVSNNNVVNNQIIIQPFNDCNALLVTARPDLQRAVAATIKKLDRRKRQVLLKVRFLEATYGRNFNFGTDLVFNAKQFEKNNNSVYQENIQGGPNSDATANLLGDNNPQITYMFRNNSVDFAIQAMLQKNKVKLLSQPRLLTCDNEQATLTIGTKKPILKSTTDMTQSQGNVVSDYSYIDVGISLNITPHINPENDVNLSLDFKISHIQSYDTFPTNINVPVLSNREASTTVTVKNDHTLILAGIISQSYNETQNSVPGLGDIPMIGWMFGGESESRSQTELIILVSPSVVDTPVAGDKLTNKEEEQLSIKRDDFKDFNRYFTQPLGDKLGSGKTADDAKPTGTNTNSSTTNNNTNNSNKK